MAIDILVPTLGESVTEATLAKWFKAVGDTVAADEPLAELETDKVSLEVNAPAAGVLMEIRVPEGTDVGLGAVLGVLEEGTAANVAALVPAPTTEMAPASALAGGGTVNIIVPTLGESVTEATVAKWLKVVGDAVGAALRHHGAQVVVAGAWLGPVGSRRQSVPGDFELVCERARHGIAIFDVGKGHTIRAFRLDGFNRLILNLFFSWSFLFCCRRRLHLRRAHGRVVGLRLRDLEHRARRAQRAEWLAFGGREAPARQRDLVARVSGAQPTDVLRCAWRVVRSA